VLWQFCKVVKQGRIQGAHPARAPLKLEKNMIFWRKIVYFSHEIPQKFSRLPPLGHIFLRVPPPLTFKKENVAVLQKKKKKKIHEFPF
jgi:hypothetical protein